MLVKQQREELLSDSYSVYLKCIENYDVEKNCKFTSYLYMKMKYHILDYLRKQNKISSKISNSEIGFEEAFSNEEDYIDEDEIYNDNFNKKLLNKILKLLTRRQKYILHMYAIDKMTFEEIANELGTNKQNISQIIKRIQKRFREKD